MPLYVFASTAKALRDSEKQSVSRIITNLHSRITGAPRAFVHVFFFEGERARALGIVLSDDSSVPYLISANIRMGRDEDTKRELVTNIQERVAEQLAVPPSDVQMATRDIRASWVMEGGELLPEPGEEAAWLEKQHRPSTGSDAEEARIGT